MFTVCSKKSLPGFPYQCSSTDKEQTLEAYFFCFDFETNLVGFIIHCPCQV
jgi:hypothetical protein